MNPSPPPFQPMVSRSLKLIRPDGIDIPIYVAAGIPYRPAIMKGFEDQAGCLVLTCDDPDLTTEVCGFDEFEALAAAVSSLQLYLVKIVEETGGQLQTLDGRPVDPIGSVFLRQMQEFVSRKASKKSP